MRHVCVEYASENVMIDRAEMLEGHERLSGPIPGIT
jgi:hypothetical protein